MTLKLQFIFFIQNSYSYRKNVFVKFQVRKLEGDIPFRMFLRNKAIPGLAMSRAMGDFVRFDFLISIFFFYFCVGGASDRELGMGGKKKALIAAKRHLVGLAAVTFRHEPQRVFDSQLAAVTFRPRPPRRVRLWAFLVLIFYVNSGRK